MVTGAPPATESELTADRPTIRAGVGTGPSGSPLPPAVEGKLTRVVVDNDLRLPGMFELTFRDSEGDVLGEAGITVGTVITVSGGPPGQSESAPGNPLSGGAVPLITGEVTSIEGDLQGNTMATVVRGYTQAHRLQRAKRSRTFLNATDSSVAEQIAKGAGLTVGDVVATATTYDYLAQVNQTDWDFLLGRATEIGYETGVAGGEFYFRPASAAQAGSGASGLGGITSAVESAVESAVSGGGLTVQFRRNLIAFRPRITAGNLTPDVELRVWDPMQAVAVAQPAGAPSGGTLSAAGLGKQFTGAGSGLAGVESAVEGAVDSVLSDPMSTQSSMQGAARGVQDDVAGALGPLGGVIGSPLGNLGPPASTTAYIEADRPIGPAMLMTTAGDAGARALGADLGSTFAEAEGEAWGDAAIQPGALLTVAGVQDQFAGSWLVSRARHVFDDSDHGYRTVFFATGRQDRSMLGLTSGHGRPVGRQHLDGVVCGVVSNNYDLAGRGRVKVTLPWLDPSFETDWAPVAQFCAGASTGALFLPEVGDEVLLCFEFGDPRRPYVVGSLVNNKTGWSLNNVQMPSLAMPDAGGGSPALQGTQTLATMGVQAASGESPTGTGASGLPPVGGVQQTAGMISQVTQRGILTNTGQCLLFKDEPATPAMGGTGSVTSGSPELGQAAEAGGAVLQIASSGMAASGGGAAGGALDAAGGMLGGAGGGGIPPIASAVMLGSQSGKMGLAIDQVMGTVSLTAEMVPGVSANPVSMMTLDAGQAGLMTVKGGTLVEISSTTAIVLSAPLVTVAGEFVITGA